MVLDFSSVVFFLSSFQRLLFSLLSQTNSYVQSFTSHFFRQEPIPWLQSDLYDTCSSKAFSADRPENVEKSLLTHLKTLRIVNNTEVMTKFQ
jgi:hypothetical protein